MHSMTMDQSPDVSMESDQNNNNENSSNNNLSMKKNEKYSLRQRGQRKSITSKQAAKAVSGSSRARKANINNSADDEFAALTMVAEKVAKEKPKQKAAPLSKYRRKTANARERTRMREINHAFETLRQSVPVIVAGAQAQTTNEKLTKITTLRMAMKYIKILSDILDNKTVVSDSLLASLMEVDGGESEDASDKPTTPSPAPIVSSKPSKADKLSAPSGNVLAQNHHDYCKEAVARESSAKAVKPTKVTSKKAVKASGAKTKKPPSKAHSKTQKSSIKHQQPLAPPIISRNQSQIHQNLNETKFINHLLGGTFNQTMLNNNSMSCLSKYDLSPCLTPPNDDSPADLGLILESDGESLQLSEPCFSPLELGLLLESDGESLHLSEPCLSPLNHLDALNSFNDLLHAGFSEHNSLEMYLS